MNTMRNLDKLPAVVVEYDSKSGRTYKQFADAFAARRFYATKKKQGKNPAVKKAKSILKNSPL